MTSSLDIVWWSTTCHSRKTAFHEDKSVLCLVAKDDLPVLFKDFKCMILQVKPCSVPGSLLGYTDGLLSLMLGFLFFSDESLIPLWLVYSPAHVALVEYGTWVSLKLHNNFAITCLKF